MDNQILTADQLVTFPAVAENLAGSGLQGGRGTGDRAQDVGVGNDIFKIHWDIGVRNITDDGILEYLVFKAQRQSATPVKGTFPIASDAEVTSTGLQGSYRDNMPGWVVKFGKIAFAQAQPRTIKIDVNFGKFRMSKIRDGDFYGLVFFNRSPATVFLDWEARYYEYK